MLRCWERELHVLFVRRTNYVYDFIVFVGFCSIQRSKKKRFPSQVAKLRILSHKMPFPSDVPQPVRFHPSHALPLPAMTDFASPGPQAYEGYGVTRFDRDHRGGTFASAQDRKQGPRPPEFYDQQRRSRDHRTASGSPGPKYDNHLFQPNRTRLLPSFGRAPRPCLKDLGAPGSGTPAPGAYFLDFDRSSTLDKRPVSSVVGTLPRAQRMPQDTTKMNEPSSADYKPNVAPCTPHHGGFSFPHGSVKHRVAKVSAASRHCETKDASLPGHEELDRALLVTKPGRTTVSIGREKRFSDVNQRAASGVISAGDYDAVQASRAIARGTIGKSIGFALSTRDSQQKHMLPRGMDPDFLGLSPGPDVLPSTLSKKGVRLSPPRPGSARSNSERQTRSREGGNDPGAYNPSVDLARPGKPCISFPRSKRFTDGGKRAGTDLDAIVIPSTLDTKHGARIGTGKRFTLSAGERECFQHPAPNEYGTPKLLRPSSSSGARSILHRHENIGQLLKESRDTPGAKYDVEEPLRRVKPNSALQLSFAAAKRGLLEAKVGVKREDSPGPGDYDVRGSYDAVSKKGGAAILYLSG